MKKSQIKVVALVVVLALVLLVLGTFYDLQISKKLYQGSGNLDAKLGGFFGKLPAFLLLAFCFAILLSYVKTNVEAYKKPVYITLYILYICAMLVAFLLAFYSALEEITGKAKYLAVMLAILCTALASYIVFKRDFAHLEELKKWAILTIIGICVLLVVTVVLKKCWGRNRYMDVMGGGAVFTKWYSPQGFTGGSSFPSGHTALWGALYFLLPLFAIFEYKGALMSFVGILATQLLIGVFRIIGGYHYLSDIAMSILLSFAIAYVTFLIGYKRDCSNKVLSDKSIFRYI